MEYSGRPFSSTRVWKCIEYIDYTLFAAALFYCSCGLSTKDVAKHATSEQLEELFALYDMRQWKKGIAFCIEPTLVRCYYTTRLNYWNIYTRAVMMCIKSSSIHFSLSFFPHDYLGVYLSGVVVGERRKRRRVFVCSREDEGIANKAIAFVIYGILWGAADHDCGKGIIIMIILIISTEKKQRWLAQWSWKAAVYIGAAVLQRTTALYAAPHYTAVMTSAMRLVMDCVSLRLWLYSLFLFLFFFLSDSMNPISSRSTDTAVYKKRMSTLMTFFVLCVCLLSAFGAVSSPIPILFYASLVFVELW